MNPKPDEHHQQRHYRLGIKPSINPEFPSSRYFQIHFEHLEGQLAENLRVTVEIQRQIAELYLILGKLNPELLNQKTPE